MAGSAFAAQRAEAEAAAPAHIYLQPIAAPSVLGLFGFAGATFMVAAHMAHWYGGANTDLYLAAFAATFGGIAQCTERSLGLLGTALFIDCLNQEIAN
jgi:succinate-acetate transporter protein